MRVAILGFLLLLAQFSANGQYSKEHKAADSLARLHEWSASFNFWVEAKEGYQQLKQSELTDYAHIKAGESLYHLSLYDSAETWINGKPLNSSASKILFHKLSGLISAIKGEGHKPSLIHYKAGLTIGGTGALYTYEKARLNQLITETYLSVRNIDSASHYLKELQRLIPQVQNPGNLPATAWRIEGAIKRFELKPDSTLYYFHKAKGLLTKKTERAPVTWLDLSDLYEAYASFYAERSVLDSQNYYGRQQLIALEASGIASSAALARAYTQTAYDMQSQAQMGKADEYVNKAIATYQSMGENAPVGLGTAYMIKANLLIFKQGEFNRALELCHEAVRIFEKHYGPESAEMSKPYRQLGETYIKLQHFEEGVFYMKKALNVSIKHKDYERIYRGYAALGESYAEIGNFKEALKAYKTGWELLKQQYGPNHFANGYFAIGTAFSHAQMGQTELAESVFKEAQRVFEHNYQALDPRVANIYSHLANLYQNTRQFEKANDYYLKAVVANHTIDRETGDTTVVDLQMNLNNRENHAEVLKVLYQQAPGDDLFEQISGLYFDNLTSLLALIGETSPGEDIQAYSNRYRSTYDSLISNTLTQWDHTPPIEMNRSLFSMVENSRSVLLKGRLNDLKEASDVKESALSKLKKLALIDKIRYQQGLVSNTATDDSLVKIRRQRQLIQLNQEYEQLVKPTNNTAETLKTNVALIDSISKALPQDQSLIVFHVLKGHLLIFLIDQQQQDLTIIKKPKHLEPLITDMRNSLLAEDPEAYKAAATSLYDHLIKPLEGKIKTSRIKIIPDGALWNLNFSLLLSKADNAQKGFASLNYLIRDYSISYAYAATTRYQNPVESQSASTQFLGFSFDHQSDITPSVRTMRNEEMENLPGTAQEISDLNRLLNGRAFYGSSANESIFKQVAGDYRFIHLAMHAKVDTAADNKAYLYFSPEPEPSEEDGRLHTYELSGMRLNTEMVVLSACNSGAGKLYKGEGLIGLGSAFTYAGAKSVLLSQWEVSDATTPPIMEAFYKSLKEGESKDKALSAAMLSFLSNSNNLTANPIYWGSFFVMGDVSPVEIQSARAQGWIWVVMAVILAFLLLWRLRSQRKV